MRKTVPKKKARSNGTPASAPRGPNTGPPKKPMDALAVQLGELAENAHALYGGDPSRRAALLVAYVASGAKEALEAYEDDAEPLERLEEAALAVRRRFSVVPMDPRATAGERLAHVVYTFVVGRRVINNAFGRFGRQVDTEPPWWTAPRLASTVVNWATRRGIPITRTATETTRQLAIDFASSPPTVDSPADAMAVGVRILVAAGLKPKHARSVVMDAAEKRAKRELVRRRARARTNTDTA